MMENKTHLQLASAMFISTNYRLYWWHKYQVESQAGAHETAQVLDFHHSISTILTMFFGTVHLHRLNAFLLINQETFWKLACLYRNCSNALAVNHLYVSLSVTWIWACVQYMQVCSFYSFAAKRVAQSHLWSVLYMTRSHTKTFERWDDGLWPYNFLNTKRNLTTDLPALMIYRLAVKKIVLVRISFYADQK